MNYNILPVKLDLPNDRPINGRAKLDTGTFCNYKCYFCYYKDKLDARTSTESILRQVDKLIELGAAEFDLSGGESSIHPGFFDILNYIKSKGFKASCLSNGSKFSNYDFIKKAKDHGLNEILFSLHSVDEMHDEITGIKGSFKSIIKAIENAKSLDMLVRINSTITNKNHHLVDNKYFDLIKEIKPFEMNFLPLNYFGTHHSNELYDYNIILKEVKNFIDKHNKDPFIKYINVRYTPYCKMQGYEQYVCNYAQHMYDYYDWSGPLYDCSKQNTEANYIDHIKQSRINSYKKELKCTKCKFFLICDGIEKELDSDLEPVNGGMIKNPIEFRMDYYKEKCNSQKQ